MISEDNKKKIGEILNSGDGKILYQREIFERTSEWLEKWKELYPEQADVPEKIVKDCVVSLGVKGNDQAMIVETIAKWSGIIGIDETRNILKNMNKEHYGLSDKIKTSLYSTGLREHISPAEIGIDVQEIKIGKMSYSMDYINNNPGILEKLKDMVFEKARFPTRERLKSEPVKDEYGDARAFIYDKEGVLMKTDGEKELELLRNRAAEQCCEFVVKTTAEGRRISMTDNDTSVFFNSKVAGKLAQFYIDNNFTSERLRIPVKEQVDTLVAQDIRAITGSLNQTLRENGFKNQIKENNKSVRGF